MEVLPEKRQLPTQLHSEESKGSNHRGHMKKGKSWPKMSVPAAVCGEHAQESTWWPDQLFKFGGQKKH